MSDWEEMARSIVFGKKQRIKIESWWKYVPKYEIPSGMTPALVRQRDQCRVAMPHLTMAKDPAEYETALKVIKEVVRLIDGRT